ncbi:ABC transporter permease [Roseibium sp. Sym1]|uniref:ABC transporter permease n=1 Tax=Roseibium sp. Sym1 TaxID=3016006 RepID=UPI0022B43393|nr:FtsX-like permease family protein [Roseibium sp. Sym1]
MIWTIAFRNLVKNARRSIMTALAIGVGGLAALLFGGFVTSIWFGVQTSMIQQQGHLQIYRNGYLEYGAANPEDYTIGDWPEIADLLLADVVIRDSVEVITPRIDLAGVAGNAVTGNSKTFIGQGVYPSKIDRMRQWDGWQIGQATPATGLNDTENGTVVVGLGMARMLGFCDRLQVENCRDRPEAPAQAASTPAGTDIDALVSGDRELADLSSSGSARPPLNLMAATTEGAPNIVRVGIDSAQAQAIRAVDNAFVLMHFEQAQTLLYGERPEATALMLQVKAPELVDAVKARVAMLLQDAGTDLTVYHFTEVDPTFNRIFGMFSFIFFVISLVLSIVIVFTIVNTVSMTVVERVKEIGTIRAIGFRKSFVKKLFLAESALTGLFGAAVALILAVAVSSFVNSAGLQWTPPSNATPLTVQLMVLKNPVFAASVFLALIVLAVLAAVLPTFRAARMNIVESLHQS